MKAIISGDPMITGEMFKPAYEKHIKKFFDDVAIEDFETDWSSLQDRRLKVEQQGPEIEVVPEVVLKEGKDAELLAGLFVPVSSKLMDAMPKLRIVGLARAGKENINLTEATKRGILAFNVMGRNAEAVSDFAIGLMLAESRNIAKAHNSIKNKGWQKEFSNASFVPQLKGKKIGIAGFGYIGRLVAQKLQGWDLEVLVYDAFADDADIIAANCIPVDKETLFRESDFLSIHLRLVEATKGWASKEFLDMMKPTSYIINTGRSGLIDMDYLYNVLNNKKIAGAGLDVFNEEPIDPKSPFINLDNVTLTTHIAGTTTEVLTGSPYLLFEDIEKFLGGKKANFILNPEVLENEKFKKWLDGVRK
ncbi:MAG: 2-hydroxyacid dehydrogenase [Candidatus Izemoplasmatales bacterium]